MTVKNVTAGVLALVIAAAALPVLADGNVTVRNRNWASVTNLVTSGANSGGNTAGGSHGGDGGSGGSVSNSGGDQNVDHTGTGNGGNGGNAGDGGLVTTGTATSGTTVTNDVNNNNVDVNLCGCAGTTTVESQADVEDNNVLIKNKNDAELGNLVASGADSGSNRAKGSRGGRGGNGGDIGNSGASQDVNHTTTGNAGNGGNGALGGTVDTTGGAATSNANVTNRVNYNVVRVVR